MFFVGPLYRVYAYSAKASARGSSKDGADGESQKSLVSRLAQLAPIVVYYVICSVAFHKLNGGSSATATPVGSGVQRYLTLWAFLLTNAYNAVIIVFSNLVNRRLQ